MNSFTEHTSFKHRLFIKFYCYLNFMYLIITLSTVSDFVYYMYMYYYGNFNATTLPKFLSLLVDCALFAIIIIIIVFYTNRYVYDTISPVIEENF